MNQTNKKKILQFRKLKEKIYFSELPLQDPNPSYILQIGNHDTAADVRTFSFALRDIFLI